jgi:hypothetical protein
MIALFPDWLGILNSLWSIGSNQQMTESGHVSLQSHDHSRAQLEVIILPGQNSDGQTETRSHHYPPIIAFVSGFHHLHPHSTNVVGAETIIIGWEMKSERKGKSMVSCRAVVHRCGTQKNHDQPVSTSQDSRIE